jgi:hypothetical protein
MTSSTEQETSQEKAAVERGHGDVGNQLLTCSASPRGKLRDLIPPVLLEVIAFHTADGLGCLAANYNHDLQKDRWILAGSSQQLGGWVTISWSLHMLADLWGDLSCQFIELCLWRCWP